MNPEINAQIAVARQIKNLLTVFKDAEEVLQAVAAHQAHMGDMDRAVNEALTRQDELQVQVAETAGRLLKIQEEEGRGRKALEVLNRKVAEAERKLVEVKKAVEDSVASQSKSIRDSVDSYRAELAEESRKYIEAREQECAAADEKLKALKSELAAIRTRLEG